MKIAMIAALVSGAAAWSGIAAAQGNYVLAHKEMMVYDKCDTNKDGMVTREEYLQTMAKIWDDAMKKMSVSAAGMNKQQYQQFTRLTFVQ